MDREDLRAMAYGYGAAIPLCVFAIAFGVPVGIAAPVCGMIGFIITMMAYR